MINTTVSKQNAKEKIPDIFPRSYT